MTRPPLRMRTSTRTWAWRLATGLCGFTALLLPGLLLLMLLNRDAPDVWRITGSQFQIASGIAYSLVGWLIAIRRPGNALGWLFLILGLGFQLSSLAGQWAVYGLETRAGVPGAALALWLSLWLTAATFGPTFPLLLFPSGRFPDRKTLLIGLVSGLAAVWLVLALVSAHFVPPGFPAIFERTPQPLAWRAEPLVDPGLGVITLGLCGLIAAGLLLARFRQARGIARQQYQWVVLAMVLFVVAFVADFVVRSADLPGALITELALSLTTALLPVSMGVAILRYHLFDIDQVFNRALVYTGLTVTLGLVYVGAVLVFHLLLRPLAPESDVVIAGSTLLVAALFQPARRRIQVLVDRRFYRRKYDALRTVAGFSIMARNEVDLERLTSGLVSVVTDTLQPASVSLWLRDRVE